MAGDSDNIFVGNVTACYYDDEGTTLPTSLSNWESIKATWTAVGLISEDGFTETPSWDTTDVKDADGNVVRTIKNTDAYEVAFAMQETTDAVTDFVQGGHGTTGTPFDYTGTMPSVKAVILDLRDTEGSKQRLVVIPRAQVKEQTERVYSAAAPAMWGVTITAYKTTDGYKMREFRGTYA